MAKFRVKKGETLRFGTTADDHRTYAEGEIVEMTPNQGAACDAVEPAGKPAETAKP